METTLICGECLKIFSSKQARRDHQRATNHPSEFSCCDCSKKFSTRIALTYHTHHHQDLTPKKVTPYCSSCDKPFGDANALRKHMASLKHNPLNTLGCRCKKKFYSPSSLLLHLESGCCGSGMNRQLVNQAVLANDLNNVISAPDDASRHNILPYVGDSTLTSSSRRVRSQSILSDESSDVVILTPPSGMTSLSSSQILTSDGSLEQALELTATPLRSFRCPLCKPTRAPFASRMALDMHIASPAHAKLIFHCPVSFTTQVLPGRGEVIKSTYRTFKTVSGLAAHVETGACKGGKKGLKQAVRFLEDKLAELGFGSKLVSQ